MDLKEQYRMALDDLKFNSKPIIDQLAMLAGENIGNCNIIVQCIEERIVKSPPNLKLPFVYLMDCVLKNVGKQYVPEFQKNLHQTIPIVFKCSEEKDRQRIQRLIMTWKTFPKGNIFPMAVISKLEKELQAIVQKEKEPAPGPTAQSVQTQIEILIQKKKALNPILYPQVAGEIDVMNQLLHVIRTTRLDQATINQVANQIKQMASTLPKASPMLPLGLGPSLSGVPMNYGTVPPSLANLGLGSLSMGLGFSLPNTLPSNLPVNLSGLGSNLVSSSKVIPMIPLTQKDINKTYPNIYYHLYERNELQCRQCGIRFETVPNGKQDLEQHLDWHFRQKRRQKERKTAYSRDWYHSVDDWVTEQPVEMVDQNVPNLFSTQVEEQEPESVIPAGSSDVCVTCGEKLEKFYDDEQDEWMVKNAVKVGEKLYHETCHSGTPVLGKRTMEQGQPEKRLKTE